MLTYKEEHEHAILSIIHLSEEPIGSGTIREQVLERDIEISEATVGRMLKEMDHKGFTIRRGFQGRILTDDGYKRLCELKHRKESNSLSRELNQSLQADSKKNMIDALVARRATEGEIAALAAVHITPQESAEITKIIAHHELHRQRGEFAVDQDIAFHRMIARASRNQVLEKVVDLIRQQFRHSPFLEHIRKEMLRDINEEHRMILDAINSGDPAAARNAMNSHIDSLITDVETYWQKKQLTDDQ